MLTSATKNNDTTMAIVNAIMGGSVMDTEVSPGIYEIGHHNFSNTIIKKNDYPDLVDKDGEYFGPYGVCDYIEQVFDKCPMLRESEDKYCVAFTKVNRDEQPPEGGWRWHKWGTYIGVYDIVCEYLHDDSVVDSIYCYHIFEL